MGGGQVLGLDEARLVGAGGWVGGVEGFGTHVGGSAGILQVVSPLGYTPAGPDSLNLLALFCISLLIYFIYLCHGFQVIT